MTTNRHLEVSDLTDKVIVTGLYGSGKTTLAKRLSSELHYTFISFDDLFDYRLGWTDESVDPIFKRMGEEDRFVIDASPKYFDPRLIRFVEDHNCTTILVVCNKKTWIERVKRSKSQHSPVHYNEFYDEYLPVAVERNWIIHDNS